VQRPQSLPDRGNGGSGIGLPPCAHRAITRKRCGDQPRAGVVTAAIQRLRHGMVLRGPGHPLGLTRQVKAAAGRRPLDEAAPGTLAGGEGEAASSLTHTSDNSWPPAAAATDAGTVTSDSVTRLRSHGPGQPVRPAGLPPRRRSAGRFPPGELPSTRVMIDHRSPNGSRIDANRSPETNVVAGLTDGGSGSCAAAVTSISTGPCPGDPPAPPFTSGQVMPDSCQCPLAGGGLGRLPAPKSSGRGSVAVMACWLCLRGRVAGQLK
jgi:hypothetical protein